MVFSYSLSKRYHQRNGHLVVIVNNAHFFLLTLGRARPSLVNGLFSSGAERGLLSSWCAGFSVAERRLSGTRASVVAASGLWSTDSAIAAHRLSCSVAGRIFPELGLNVLVP